MITSSPTPHHIFDELTTSLAKLDSLLKIASSADIAKFQPETALHYFWVAEDMLEKIRNAFDRLAKQCDFN